MHSQFVRHAFVAVWLIYLTLYTLHAAVVGKTVYGDGIYYYSWLRSLVVDQDIDFTNEYTFFGADQMDTPIGREGNIYPFGPALLALPVFLPLFAVFGGSGYEILYQYVVGVAYVNYAVLGLVLLFVTLSRMVQTQNALKTLVITAFGTNLLFYGAIDTVNSHAVSFFCSALLLALLLYRKSTHPFSLGALLGLMTLMRTQDILFGILALPTLISTKRILLFLSGLFVVLLPLAVSWNVLYGSWFISPYLYLPGYTFNWTTPKILEVLLSPNNGLFLWTPAAALGFGGLLLGWNQTKSRQYILSIIVFLLQLYTVASWSVWWQGASFSGRMFVGCLPLLAIGISFIAPKITQLHIIATITYNAVLIVFFLLRN